MPFMGTMVLVRVPVLIMCADLSEDRTERMDYIPLLFLFIAVLLILMLLIPDT